MRDIDLAQLDAIDNAKYTLNKAALMLNNFMQEYIRPDYNHAEAIVDLVENRWTAKTNSGATAKAMVADYENYSSILAKINDHMMRASHFLAKIDDCIVEIED